MEAAETVEADWEAADWVAADWVEGDWEAAMVAVDWVEGDWEVVTVEAAWEAAATAEADWEAATATVEADSVADWEAAVMAGPLAAAGMASLLSAPGQGLAGWVALALLGCLPRPPGWGWRCRGEAPLAGRARPGCWSDAAPLACPFRIRPGQGCSREKAPNRCHLPQEQCRRGTRAPHTSWMRSPWTKNRPCHRGRKGSAALASHT